MSLVISEPGADREGPAHGIGCVEPAGEMAEELVLAAAGVVLEGGAT